MDEYAKQLFRQNEGKHCEHCNSCLGHFSNCSLINREASEAILRFNAENHSYTRMDEIVPEFTEGDVIALHALGVRL